MDSHPTSWLRCGCIACVCETWLIHVCGTTRSYVWHDSFICVGRRIYECNMTHLSVWHDGFIRVTWLIYGCGICATCVWHVCMCYTHEHTWVAYVSCSVCSWHTSRVCDTVYVRHVCDTCAWPHTWDIQSNTQSCMCVARVSGVWHMCMCHTHEHTWVAYESCSIVCSTRSGVWHMCICLTLAYATHMRHTEQDTQL